MTATASQLGELLAANLPARTYTANEAVLVAYATDNSRRFHLPAVVAWPEDEEQVAALVKVAATTGTPLHARGRGTATTGASLAERGGIVLSTERLAAIRNVDPQTRTATVEPGVLNGELAAAAAAHGLFWPPDPSSSAYCTVGGNLATAAAGPRGVRYGGAREHTLAVRAVCGDGRVISAGAPVTKLAAGYDLPRLLVGSEGTLAVITEATLRLVPLPAHRTGCLAAYPDAASALAAAGRLMATTLEPAAVEFMDGGCVGLVRAACPELPAGTGGLLLVALDADSAAAARADLATARAALEDGALAVTEAAPGTGAWRARPVLSQKLRDRAAIKVNEDVVVPVGELNGVIEVAQEQAAKAGFDNLNFGHAGAGNLHVNFLYGHGTPGAATKVAAAVAALMEHVTARGGGISGEHGIGISKREYLPLQLDPVTARLCREIKRVFDPAGILNPGKLGGEE